VHLCLHIGTAARRAPGARVQVQFPSLLTDSLEPHSGCEALSFVYTSEKPRSLYPRASCQDYTDT
jgi:hypothetical protein